MDLTVCVGESCHLNGAEVVLKTFQQIIRERKLDDRLTLKASFCIGQCQDEDNRVSFRLGASLHRIDHQQAARAFADIVDPALAGGGGN